MGRVVDAISSERCRILQPLAVAAFVLACLVSHACGSCLSYGHSCWGAHGKRSGGQQGVAWNHAGRELIDAESDRISRGTVPQGPTSSPPTPNSEDTLWLISKLMAAATTQLEPEEGEEEPPSHSEEEDDDPDAVGTKIWRRLLDVNQGMQPHRVPKVLKASKVHLEKIAVPTQRELGSGVGIIGIASTTNGDLGRGLVVLADDLEEDEDEEDDQNNDSKERDIVNENEMEDQGEGKRLSRKALRRLRILNLLDNMEKRSN